MKALAEFLAMGGYARFVWPAYGAAALVLGWMVVDSLVAYRRRQRELLALERQRAPR
jgi:heme exporter protein D